MTRPGIDHGLAGRDVDVADPEVLAQSIGVRLEQRQEVDFPSSRGRELRRVVNRAEKLPTSSASGVRLRVNVDEWYQGRRRDVRADSHKARDIDGMRTYNAYRRFEYFFGDDNLVNRDRGARHGFERSRYVTPERGSYVVGIWFAPNVGHIRLVMTAGLDKRAGGSFRMDRAPVDARHSVWILLRSQR